MKKIFVTGGTGFIGEEVCLGLRRAGHQVTALVRDIVSFQNLKFFFKQILFFLTF